MTLDHRSKTALFVLLLLAATAARAEKPAAAADDAPLSALSAAEPKILTQIADQKNAPPAAAEAAPAAPPAAAVPTTLKRAGAGWILLRGGAPYFIRGAGSPDYIADLQKYGGNSIRTWGTETLPELLRQANAHGMTVLAGLWLLHKGDMDYANPEQVAAQREKVLADVAKYKDDPAILAWGLGNEMESADNDTPELWSAVGELAAAIKKIDPNHPVVTVVSEIGGQKLANILRYAPGIDVLGVNSYGGLPTLKKRLDAAGWTKPYIVTEFGPRGPWESARTSWGAPIEPTSAQKAAAYRSGYQASIAGVSGCLGSYAFLWGDKDEGTRTWFGMLMPETHETLSAVDAVSEEWTGRRPDGVAPEISALRFAAAGKKIAPGAALTACADVVDAGGDSVALTWRLAADSAGAPDLRRQDGLCLEFTAPSSAGAYRLYAEARDGHGRGATANAAFFVDDAPPPAP